MSRTVVACVAVLALLVTGCGTRRVARPGEGGRAPRAATDQSTSTPMISGADTGGGAPARPRAPTVITVGWVGDMTPGSARGLPPDDGRPLFERVRSELRRPDLMMSNLEGTFGTGGPSKCDGKPPETCWAFQAPPANARSLADAGFDLVNLANNHSRDYLGKGLAETQDALKRRGIAWTGLGERATYLDVKGLKVAVLGFSPYWWTNRIQQISNAAWLVELAAAKADVVVVLMHAGAEGPDKSRTPTGTERHLGEDRGDPRAFAHAVVDAGADLVFGSGPHVVRGIERYKSRLVAYSLGNFAGWGNFDVSGPLSLSGILTVRVDQDGKVLGARWSSMKIDDPGVPRPDASRESWRLVRRLSKQDFVDTFRMDGTGGLSQ